MARADLDTIDYRILSVIQQDSSLSCQQISDRIHLSLNAVWRRLKRLEEDGYVRQKVALLDAAKFGLHVVALLRVRLGDRHPAAMQHFLEQIGHLPQIVETYGVDDADADLFLKARVCDRAAGEALVARLMDIGSAIVAVSLVTREIRVSTALPLQP